MSFHKMTNADMVSQFNQAMGVTISRDYINRDLRFRLIKEELREVEVELFPFDGKINPEKLGKELADLLYVVYGCADALGLPIDKIFEAVHVSNMSKLVDGKPVKREDGKVLKGPNYTPPDLSWVA